MGLWVISWRTVAVRSDSDSILLVVTVNLLCTLLCTCYTVYIILSPHKSDTPYNRKCKYDLTYTVKQTLWYSLTNDIDMIWPTVDTVHEVELHSSKQLEPTKTICSARYDHWSTGYALICYVCDQSDMINRGIIWSIGADVLCSCDQSGTINRGWHAVCDQSEIINRSWLTTYEGDQLDANWNKVFMS